MAHARNKLAKKIDKAIEPEKSFGISVEEIKIPNPIKNIELFIAKKLQKKIAEKNPIARGFLINCSYC